MLYVCLWELLIAQSSLQNPFCAQEKFMPHCRIFVGDVLVAFIVLDLTDSPFVVMGDR